MMVGTAHIKSTILIWNGNQRFLLIVNEASVGPRKETTYDVELMYEKCVALKHISLGFFVIKFNLVLTVAHNCYSTPTSK